MFNPFRFIDRVAASLPARLERLFSSSRHPLLRGDLLEYAERKWPKSIYSTAWAEIPEDMRLSLIWDGKLLNGDEPAELAKAYVTDELVSEIARKAGYRALAITAGLGVAVVLALEGFGIRGLSLGGNMTTPYPQWAADAGAIMPVLMWWPLHILESAWGLVGTAIVLALPAVFAFFPLWAFSFAAGIGRAWADISYKMRLPTREAGIMWKANAVIRLEQYAAYCDQVEQATGWLAGSPVIPLGKASGVSRSRHDTFGPRRGQVIGWDRESVRLHSITIAPTGSGKTRDFITPVCDRLGRVDWGNGAVLGFYVTDGKGVLYKDLLPLFAHRQDDIRVLGTGADEFGLNLCDDMTPLEVADTFIGVACQVNGNPDDTFWQEAASGLLMNAAMVALAIDTDPAAKAAWIANKGVRPYSMLGIAQIASEKQIASEAFAVVTEILRNAEEGKYTPAQVAILDAGADACDRYEAWLAEKAKETVSSIVQNIDTVLGKLVGAPDLSRRFCTGLYDGATEDGELVDVNHALKGGIVMVAISQNEHGQAGKVVMTWLKSRLYVMARRREKLDKAGTEKFPCAFVCDEAQELLTVGGSGDSSFWNVARSTNLFAIMASQSIATIYEAMGEGAARNFLEQMRTKVFMKSTEEHTVNLAKFLSGDAPRGWEYEDNLYSSETAREVALGGIERPTVEIGGLAGFIPGAFQPSTYRFDAYSASHLWGRLGGGGRLKNMADNIMGAGGGGDQTGTAISIQTRHEDKNRAAMVDGVTFTSRLTADELKLGGGRAFVVVQRAGGERRDIINLRDIAA